MTWREKAEPIIRDVLDKTKGQPEAVVTKALHDAYPFGLRENHPYKVWCDEVQRQRGHRKPVSGESLEEIETRLNQKYVPVKFVCKRSECPLNK